MYYKAALKYKRELVIYTIQVPFYVLRLPHNTYIALIASSIITLKFPSLPPAKSNYVLIFIIKQVK